MKLKKKCWLTTLLFRQAQLIVGVAVCLSSATFFPVFGDEVSKSEVIQPREQCKYHDAWVVITFPETAHDKDLNDALDKLVEAVGEEAVENAVKAVGQLHKDFKGALAHAIIVYECKDEKGKIHQYRYDCDDSEDLAFKPAIANAATTKDAAKADRETTIKRHCPKQGCCGDKATGGATPPPAGQPPPPGAGAAPQPPKPTNLCNLKRPCKECEDLYEKKLPEITKLCERLDVVKFELRQLENEWLKTHKEIPDARSADDDAVEFYAKVRPLQQELADIEGQLKDILKELKDCEEKKCPKNKQLVLAQPPFNASTQLASSVSGPSSTGGSLVANAPAAPAPPTDRSLSVLGGKPQLFVAGEVTSQDQMLVTVRGTNTIEGVVVSAEANGQKTEARTDSKGQAVLNFAALSLDAASLATGIIRAFDAGGHELAQEPTKITPGASSVTAPPEVPTSLGLLRNGSVVTIPGKNLGSQSQLVVGNRAQETLSASSKELTSFVDAPALGPQPAYVRNPLGASPTQTVHCYNFTVTASQTTLVRGQHALATGQYEGLPPGTHIEFTNVTPGVVKMTGRGGSRCQGEHCVFTVSNSAGICELDLIGEHGGAFVINYKVEPPQ